MEKGSIILLIVFILAIILSIGFCAKVNFDDFREEKETEPAITTGEVLLRARVNSSEYVGGFAEIYGNGTKKTIELNKNRYVKTTLYSDNEIYVYGDNIISEKKHCDIKKESCLLDMKRKDSVGFIAKNDTIRLACNGDGCIKALICYKREKIILSRPMQIFKLKITHNGNEKTIQGYEKCFEQFFEDSVIDFTMNVEVFSHDPNDYIVFEAFDESFFNGEIAYMNGTNDLGYKNPILYYFTGDERFCQEDCI